MSSVWCGLTWGNAHIQSSVEMAHSPDHHDRDRMTQVSMVAGERQGAFGSPGFSQLL